jgi:hypothetical protein
MQNVALRDCLPSGHSSKSQLLLPQFFISLILKVKKRKLEISFQNDLLQKRNKEKYFFLRPAFI